MEEHADHRWEVDDEEVSDEVQRLTCVQVEWPSHASKQIFPNACWHVPSFILPLKSTESGKESLELRVGNGGGGCSDGCGVGHDGCLLYALQAKAALGGKMHAPSHVVHAPMVSMFAHLLGFLVAVLGRDLLPRLILLLPVLVTPVLLVVRLLVVVEGIFEMFVGLEVFLESFNLGGYGNDLLVVGRPGAPLSLLLEVTELAHGKVMSLSWVMPECLPLRYSLWYCFIYPLNSWHGRIRYASNRSPIGSSTVAPRASNCV